MLGFFIPALHPTLIAHSCLSVAVGRVLPLHSRKNKEVPEVTDCTVQSRPLMLKNVGWNTSTVVLCTGGFSCLLAYARQWHPVISESAICLARKAAVRQLTTKLRRQCLCIRPVAQET